MPLLLLLAGAAVSFYCLWQFRRWLGEPAEMGSVGSQRLETLVDELVATAEATSAVVEAKAEALMEVIAQADQRIAALAGAVPPTAAPAPEAPAPAPAPEAAAPAAAAPESPQAAGPAAGQPDLQRRVYELADSGQDVTAIAKGLGLTKGEVLLVLGLRRSG